jgi:predicted transposase YbfD/YdcC
VVQRCPDLGDHFALDGKTLRRSHDGQTPAVHLLSAFAPKVQAAIGQLRVDAKTNEHKAALRLLGVRPALAGKVVTGDAIFCQTEVAEVLEKQGTEQVIRVERVRAVAGTTTRSVDYDLTSLDGLRAGAFDLLAWIRAHWAIENPQPDCWRSDNLCVAGRAGYHHPGGPVRVGRVVRSTARPRR